MTRAHEAIEDKAAEWVARIDLHGTPDEWAKLDTWLAASPRHRAAFLRLSVAWRRADQLRNLVPAGSEVDEDLLDPSAWNDSPEEAVSSVEPAPAERALSPSEAPQHSQPHALHLNGLRAVGARSPERRHVRRPFFSAGASRIAASFVIVLLLATAGVGGWFALSDRPSSRTYSTVMGEFRRISLGDGSTLSLNTNSEAKVTFSAKNRKVELVRGEGLFKVARDTSRPFDVHAGSTVVRAVGTEFSVRLRDESSVDVLVAEGKVSINPPSSPTFPAGSSARVRGGRVTSDTLPSSDISDRLSWSTTQRLVFKGETLAAVVEEFNRYNDRKLVVPVSALAQQHIGGSFPATDPDGFAIALQRMLPVHARHLHRGDGVEVISLETGAPMK